MEKIDFFEIGIGVAFAAVLIFALAPIIERAEAVFAFFDMMERGMR